MKKDIALTLTLLVTGSLFAADSSPTNQVKAAIDRLKAQTNSMDFSATGLNQDKTGQR
jgi:hypothetical protein